MSQDVQADENVRNKKPVVVSRIHDFDPNQKYGERYGVDWVYGREFGATIKEATLYGNAMARAGWNGKDQFVYYVPPASYPAQTGVAQAVFGEGNLVPYEGYYAIKNAQGRVSVWVPSTGDLQADDWYIIEQDELFTKYHPTPGKTGSLNYEPEVLKPEGGREEKGVVQRVITEREELERKWQGLSRFVGSDAFKALGEVQQDLLVKQRDLMYGYLTVLDARLADMQVAS